MTRVIVAASYGGPEALTLRDEQVRSPRPGEAVLEVRAAGVNPADWKSYSGAWGADPTKLPIRLGYEAAGVVADVGPDAVGPAGPVRVGDEVIAFRVAGAYAERLVVKAAALVPKPAGMAWEEAAGLMLAGATAYHALVASSVAAGDTVLVHGAAGGVGLMAVQLAVARGARVIGTASPGRHTALRELGAEPTAYGPGLADRLRALAPAGIDAAVDTVGTDEAVDVSVELVRDRERVVTIAAFERGEAVGIRRIGGGPGADPGTALRDAARLELVRLVEQGALRVFVDEAFPLAAAAEAHRLGQQGHSHGKIVLVP
ncbi:NADP-dependent oxidoreductase [Motilibacter deserti]|uniref:NADP-dependent oxidoreductase n=1 Tax=Motilibacter deserti TaxID=2714956 RepID=A0ABX0GVP4_9ACTN|nr:NADP-dependent oxidoreductase [Motilibacter deserti]NHC13709.1 NADP-dependent oxidoreductase [Motilibacter deserti]